MGKSAGWRNLILLEAKRGNPKEIPSAYTGDGVPSILEEVKPRAARRLSGPCVSVLFAM